MRRFTGARSLYPQQSRRGTCGAVTHPAYGPAFPGCRAKSARRSRRQVEILSEPVTFPLKELTAGRFRCSLCGLGDHPATGNEVAMSPSLRADGFGSRLLLLIHGARGLVFRVEGACKRCWTVGLSPDLPSNHP